MANFSDDGVRFFSAYGHRLRKLAPGRADGTNRQTDQITEAIRRLKVNPDDRQVVLTIRDPQDMWYKGKDTACNLMVDCKVRDGKLNITVFNRSNDYIWGMLGTNAVQFSSLQQYMAGHIGCAVGTYHQVTNSMHVYVNEQWDKICKNISFWADPYKTDGIAAYDMMQGNPDNWDADLQLFFHLYDLNPAAISDNVFYTPYFKDVVTPMWYTLQAWKQFKETRDRQDYINLVRCAHTIQALDWQRGVKEWIARRKP
jgi:hypothetical protein